MWLEKLARLKIKLCNWESKLQPSGLQHSASTLLCILIDGHNVNRHESLKAIIFKEQMERLSIFVTNVKSVVAFNMVISEALRI
jgi:hypothetical protein